MTHPHPIADQAMERLRALADGNGLMPSAITLTGAREKTYTLEGELNLSPMCETRVEHYVGPPRGKDREIFPSAAALRAEVQRRQQEFKNHPDWIAAAIEELHAHPGEGWGLDGAKITLPAKSAVLAAGTPCPACQGQKMLACNACHGQGSSVCIQCRGQRQEFCPTCNGRGENPQNPGQSCVTCNGARYIPCRKCRAMGQITCPTCHGKRGVPCTSCKGAGQMTEEVHLTCGATTHFKMKGEHLPAGLLRGLDRLGIANLHKGHADIEIVTPKEDEVPAPEDAPAAPEPVLHYRARMPFTEMRVNFGKRKTLIGVFGKRSILMDVPPFLDESLNPWRVKLKEAGRGRASIDDAIRARAIKDALALDLQGKGHAKELRKLYPIGLSPLVAEDIFRDMHKAITRYTRKVRMLVATGCAILTVGFFIACLYTSLPEKLAEGPGWVEAIFDFAPPLLAMALDWVILDAATYYALHRHFPDLKIALRQRTGITGYAMEIGIVLVWFTVLAFSPARPPWLDWLFPAVQKFHGLVIPTQ
ncbi:MAG: hypothetical protein SFW62_05740 [Alphaproteobacteria bacterium]|nr:hypothetical protein [Alphaproteobacteria bacterium]